MILFPPAKINLGLRVLAKRRDGYHDLESLMLQLPWCDILEIVPSGRFSFTNTGIAVPGDEKGNLCIRAYQLLSTDFKLPEVSIHLHKNIPMGAGMGGGSSDGTYTLLLLNRLFDLKLSADQLRMYALQLGSDCPFFVSPEAQLATGRGEVLEAFPLNLSGCFVHLINPGIHISTKEAFENIRPGRQPDSIRGILGEEPEHWRDKLENDFEKAVFPLYPELAVLKEKLYANGAFYASMSGSGSTLFGIYREKPGLLSGEDTKIVEKIVSL